MKKERPAPVYIIKQNFSFDVKLLHFGLEQDKFQHIENMVIDRYVFCYVTEGRGIYKINGKEHVIKKGDIFYMPQNVPHSRFNDPEDPYQYYYLAFYGHAGAFLLEKAGFSVENPILSAESDFVRKKMEKIYECFAEDTFSSIMQANMLFIEILSHLIDLREENHEKIRQNKLISLEQAQIYIEDNYTRDITVAEICRKLFINHSYFTSLFKKVYGVSPNKYLINYRIDRAMYLMQTTDMSVSKIAQAVGFNDYTNFFKNFKARVGRPPKEYQIENKLPPPRLNRLKANRKPTNTFRGNGKSCNHNHR